MAFAIVELEILVDSQDARRLLECTARRLQHDDHATQNTDPGIHQIRIQVGPGEDTQALAERLRDECAAKLEITNPWELALVPPQ